MGLRVGAAVLEFVTTIDRIKYEPDPSSALLAPGCGGLAARDAARCDTRGRGVTGQRGIVDDELVKLMDDLGFELVYFENGGQWAELPAFEKHAFVFSSSASKQNS